MAAESGALWRVTVLPQLAVVLPTSLGVVADPAAGEWGLVAERGSGRVKAVPTAEAARALAAARARDPAAADAAQVVHCFGVVGAVQREAAVVGGGGAGAVAGVHLLFATGRAEALAALPRRRRQGVPPHQDLGADARPRRGGSPP